MSENSVSENQNKKERMWYQKKRYMIPLIIFALFVILVAVSPSDTSTDIKTDLPSNQNIANLTEEKDTAQNKIKEGDVISGIGRKELEDNYNEEKNKSKFKADEYAKSLTGEEIVWVGKVENVDTNPINNTPYINIKMGIYTVRAYDKTGNYTDLEKGQTVKLTGKIESIVELFGLDVYIDITNIEVV